MAEYVQLLKLFLTNDSTNCESNPFFAFPYFLIKIARKSKVVNGCCSFAEYEANLEDKITGETSGHFQRMLVVLLQVSISVYAYVCVWFSFLFV